MTPKETIRLLRLRMGLSQENMAKMLGIAQSSYSRIESGKSRLYDSLIFKLAKIFDTSPQKIMIKEEEEVTPPPPEDK